jgi:hypothetical protein
VPAVDRWWEDPTPASASFPHGPADQPWRDDPAYYVPPRRQNYNPGPGRNGHYASPKPAPPPDIFAGFLGPEVDAAKQMTQQFLSLMGFPHNIDANQLTLQLLRSGQVSNTQAAMNFLFFQGQGITNEMRNGHEWAQFGMDAASYTTRRDQMDQTFMALLGADPQYLGHDRAGKVAVGDEQLIGASDLQDLYYTAFKGGWSQQQILQQLDLDPKYKGLLEQEPWLAGGQGFGQAKQSFSSIYGSAPVDEKTLAAWWRFNTGASQLTRSTRGEAITTAVPQPGTSEGR